MKQMVDYDDRTAFGIICKVRFCQEDSEVYNKDMCPEHNREDYRDLMKSGKWPKRYGNEGKWEWGTPRDYMQGSRTKLLLYDGHEQAITVDANVSPESSYEQDCECPDGTRHHFHFRNIMIPNEVRVLDKNSQVSVRKIRRLPGFKNFNKKGDRQPYRLISKKDYDRLFQKESS